jgi:hypothetical protein
MSDWLFWGFIAVASVAIVVLPICTFPLHRKPAGDLTRMYLPALHISDITSGNPVYKLEHECWPTQPVLRFDLPRTADWFGHDSTCRTYPCSTVTPTRAAIDGSALNAPTRAKVDYWLTGLGTRDQINAAGYEAVPVTEFGSVETRYVKGRRIEGHRGQVEPRVAVQPTVTPRSGLATGAEFAESMRNAERTREYLRREPEPGGRPDWLPGGPV